MFKEIYERISLGILFIVGYFTKLKNYNSILYNFRFIFEGSIFIERVLHSQTGNIYLYF